MSNELQTDDFLSRGELKRLIEHEIIERHRETQDRRRKTPRFPLSGFAKCMNLNRDLSPKGPTFSAKCRDISTEGIGLICTNRVNVEDLVAIRVPSLGPQTILAKVQWVRAIGHFQSSFEVGFQFVSR